jgi:hypothetical protein
VTALFSKTGLFNVTGTPTVNLSTVLYTIKTQYFDPIKKSNQPLPPHYYALYQPGNGSTIFAGSASDDAGVSAIKMPNPLPDGEYALALYPLPDDVRASYMSQNEAWIDLTTNKWVTPPPPAGPRLDKRKQVRIPYWSTVHKAYYGGGFADAPPKAKDYFFKKGLLKKEEIEPYGTASTPWSIVIDNGWIKAHVRYTFINWKDGKAETLPPGLVVVATNKDGKVAGAGTTIDDADGTAYVLVAAPQAKWSDLHLGFKTPAGTRVDLSSPAASPDTRLTCTGAVPADRNLRNTLPNEWHSYGAGAQYAASATGTPGGRKTWTELRKNIAADGSATEPLIVFQLDDVVLYDKNKLAKVPASTRLTLFDHLLAIRNPDTSMPHLTTGSFASPLLDQTTVYPVGAAAPSAPTVMRDLSARLISTEGKFYDLEEKRVVGTAGKTVCLGTRAAVISDHPIADYKGGCSYIDGEGHHELHYVPVPGVKDPATSLQLSHLLVYVGSKVTVDSDATGVSDLYKNLTYSSVRWSQGHPGVKQPGASSPAKDYRIVPTDSSKRGSDVTRLRFYFGVRTDGNHKFEVELVHDPTPVTQSGKRSFVQGGKMTYYDRACTSDAGGSTPFKDADNAPAYWHTLAHEFGHVCGLPDEYYEQLGPETLDPGGSVGLKLTNPFLPNFHSYNGWKSDTRPYWGDLRAMMRGNALPRLRHVWHHAHAFGADPAFSAVPNHPHLARNEGYPGGGLDYLTPEGDKNNPYFPVIASNLDSGKGDLTLFPIGEDEGVVEAMFSPGTPRASGSRFDALLVVRSKFRFDFDSSIPLTAQWDAMNSFEQSFYDASLQQLLRFQLVGGSRFKRIAVLFHPAYAYGGVGIFSSDGSDFYLSVTGSTKVADKDNPFVADSPPSKFKLGLPDISPWPLMNIALGWTSWVATPDGKGRTPATTAPAGPSLRNLAGKIDQLLGDAKGTRSVQAI